MGEQGEPSNWEHHTMEALQYISEEMEQPDWQERADKWEDKRRSEVPSWQREQEYRQAEKQHRLEERQRRKEEQRKWDERERRRREEQSKKYEERERQYMQRVEALRTTQEIQSIEGEEILLKQRSNRQRTTGQSQSSSRQLQVEDPESGQTPRDPYVGTSSGTTAIGNPSGERPGRPRTSIATQSIADTSDRPQEPQTQADIPPGRARASSVETPPPPWSPPVENGGQVDEVTPSTSGCQCCCLIV